MSFDNKIVMTMYLGNGCSIKMTHDYSDVRRPSKTKATGGVGYTILTLNESD